MAPSTVVYCKIVVSLIRSLFKLFSSLFSIIICALVRHAHQLGTKLWNWNLSDTKNKSFRHFPIVKFHGLCFIFVYLNLKNIEWIFYIFFKFKTHYHWHGVVACLDKHYLHQWHLSLLLIYRITAPQRSRAYFAHQTNTRQENKDIKQWLQPVDCLIYSFAILRNFFLLPFK